MNEDAIWHQREEVVYPERFGSAVHGIFPLTKRDFTSHCEPSLVATEWLQCGVFAFEPTATRDSWLYVTSGTSNPGLATAATAGSASSGLGTELLLETKQQASWATALLKQLLVYNLLAAAGLNGEQVPLDYWHRRSIPTPLDGWKSERIDHLLINVPPHLESTFTLPSGQVDLLHVIGITQAERDVAEQRGGDQLLQQLQNANAYPLTTPERGCTCSH